MAQIERLVDKVKNEKELLEALRDWARGIIKSSGEAGRKAIPGIVLCHGFQDWRELLYRQFPSITETLQDQNEEKKFFEIFCNALFQGPPFEWLVESEKQDLVEKSWKAYLED